MRERAPRSIRLLIANNKEITQLNSSYTLNMPKQVQITSFLRVQKRDLDFSLKRVETENADICHSLLKLFQLQSNSLQKLNRSCYFTKTIRLHLSIQFLRLHQLKECVQNVKLLNFQVVTLGTIASKIRCFRNLINHFNTPDASIQYQCLSNLHVCNCFPAAHYHYQY